MDCARAASRTPVDVADGVTLIECVDSLPKRGRRTIGQGTLAGNGQVVIVDQTLELPFAFACGRMRTEIFESTLQRGR
jgi:hypothetical protein